ncbi:MAG: serine hydrolase domain-containing protein [Pyrinomonadaceae bacterium]
MTNKLRALLCATLIPFGSLFAAPTPAAAYGGTTLQAIRGSGEFETLEAAVTVTAPEEITLQWTTDQSGATGGTWRVTNVSAGNKLVASGEAPAPALGHFVRFTIAANAFLLPTPPSAPVKFNITIAAHDAAKHPLGAPSVPVIVSQVPEGSKTPPVKFGAGAVFPSLEVATYVEKVGVVPLTQLHFAGADLTLRVSNRGKTATDPVWLTVKDQSVLMRQHSPVSVPSLKPGGTQLVGIHLDAILPPPTSQLPEDKQYTSWRQQYRDRCGVDLRGVMDWRGPQAQAPADGHRETRLPQEGWGNYYEPPHGAPVCDGKQCVKPCQVAINIHDELDGSAVGYSFFVGQYPGFGSYGQSRTAADEPASDFTSATKITVASVSKLVTAIAAVRILAERHIDVGAAIGPYLPSDWEVSDYVKKITFAQLLSQRSGIKDYGNVEQDYATLKELFEQPVSGSATTTCQGSDVKNVSHPINPNDQTYCYSNYNFAIFRVLLPKVAGLAEDGNPATRPQTLADQYVKLVQQNVFDPVGRKGVTCRPPAQNPGASNYALAYVYPGTKQGYDWGDRTLTCGADGWYLSVEDLAKVLASLSAGDGKILTPKQLDDMRTSSLGLDVAFDKEIEKNGGWRKCFDDGCRSITTSAAIFGPKAGPRMVGVLLVNSDIPGGGSAKSVLENAYKKALTTKP